MSKYIDAPVAKIVLSGENPRGKANVTNGDFRELCSSVKKFGVIVPLILRPHPKKKGFFELRAGERRLAAAKKNKIKTVPALLTSMTDIEAFETTMVENMHRKELDTLEQITAVATFLNKYKGDHKSVADKLGMTLQQVKLRANAVNLSKKWKAAIAKNENFRLLSAEHFDKIARLPQDIQDDLLEESSSRRIFFDWDGYVQPVKILEQFINTHYIHALSKAKWDLDTKVNSITACNDCVKRSDAQGQTDLWEDPKDKQKKTARCLDGLCWEKKDEHVVRCALIEAKPKYKNLQLASGSMLSQQEVRKRARNLGFSAEESDKVHSLDLTVPAKKNEKKSFHVFVLDGPQAGRVLLRRSKYTNDGRLAKSGGEKKQRKKIRTMKDRKRDHHGLRLKLIYPELRQAIAKCDQPKDKTLKFAAAVAAVYGTTNEFRYKGEWRTGGLSRDQIVEKLIKGEQLTLESWHNGEKSLKAKLAQALWLRARGCFTEIVPGNCNAQDALKAEAKCKAIAVLVGFDWSKALEKATKEKPDPKIWQRLKADGTPK